MSFRNKNNTKSYTHNNRFNKRTDLKISPLCDVCHKQDFKYKCSKCKTQTTKICSMDCYKEHNNTQEHHIEKESGDDILSGKTQKPVTAEQETDKQVENEVDPALMAEYKLLLENSNIQELLKYNTVKYHLNKIYQLLQLDYKSIQEDTITSQRDLDEAVARYLSCFRRNGVYRNEAIEEFALLVLKELEK